MSQKLSSTKIQYMDLEMQCWEDGITPENQTNHIIQVGLVEVDANTLTISRKENYYIKPTNKNFDITPYCTNLTGITTELLLKEGRRFNEVMSTIKNEYSPRNKVSYSWGNDNDAIREHCKNYNCNNPWANTGIWDLGIIFQSTFLLKKKLTLSKALEFLNIPFNGTPHNALWDAASLADLHIEMMKRLRGL